MAPKSCEFLVTCGESLDNPISATPLQFKSVAAAPVSTSIFTGPLLSSVTSAICIPSMVRRMEISAAGNNPAGGGGLRFLRWSMSLPSRKSKSTQGNWFRNESPTIPSSADGRAPISWTAALSAPNRSPHNSRPSRRAKAVLAAMPPAAVMEPGALKVCMRRDRAAEGRSTTPEHAVSTRRVSGPPDGVSKATAANCPGDGRT
mmetsp:Transcript_10776/g.22588  ORF Transcript_10776/g.22588 Transcript_10776/m.22588 type:complete len:203 (+) Transcript_10776:379-987(+)